ncbi:hypothetical protein [Cupriavidus metallidurans]|nr:hypothetical protein [Cupriavidus metallidurans]QBP14422.1 hypothetical protein DDF84_032405 [Cupriavidus metallidurans]
MMGNDLALLSSSCTEYKKRRNGSGNILFVVEDEEAYDFLRRSCNVILHDCGGIAAEELSFFDQWISSKGDEVEVTDLDLADALIPEEGSDTSGKATRRTRRTKS